MLVKTVLYKKTTRKISIYLIEKNFTENQKKQAYHLEIPL